MIDAREPQILERPSAQRVEDALSGRGRIDFAPCHLIEKRVQLSSVQIDLFANPTVI